MNSFEPPSRPGQFRQYSPMTIPLVVVVLLAVALLPSALNIPQANPSTVPEYAPVPPGEESENSQSGNFAGLGQTSGSSLTRAGDADFLSAPLAAAVQKRSGKRCVGDPPRQTEDPLSPPCVAVFEGDNRGGTYQGVTRDEVQVIIYVTAGGNYTDAGSRGGITRPRGVYFDLAQPAADNEPYHVEASRIWQQYFNERYQTYDRFVHFWVYYSRGDTAEDRRADAADNWEKLKPFATVVADFVVGGNVFPYIEQMARRGVLNFGSQEERSQALFQRYPKLIWGYLPSIEQHVRQFATYVCKKVVPYPVSFGNPQDVGKARRLGLLSTTDARQPAMQQFAALAKKEIEACGGNFVAEAFFPSAGFVANPAATYGADNMAKFVQNEVTTVIWAQGFEQNNTTAAGKIGYTPEWIVAGDGQLDGLVPAKYQDQNVWNHAWVVSNATLVGPWDQEDCYGAIRETGSNIPRSDTAIPCRHYRDFRQMFTGIQVAGRILTPSSVDRGFHTIPAVPSEDAEVPACFYETNDYTCVKDAVGMYWDSTARSTFSSSTGCYRVPERGTRYLPGGWPSGDVPAQRGSDDPCNGYTAGGTLDPSPGPDVAPAQ